MDSSVSPKDEILFLRVCHHISTGVYRIVLAVDEQEQEQLVGVEICYSQFLNLE